MLPSFRGAIVVALSLSLTVPFSLFPSVLAVILAPLMHTRFPAVTCTGFVTAFVKFRRTVGTPGRSHGAGAGGHFLLSSFSTYSIPLGPPSFPPSPTNPPSFQGWPGSEYRGRPSAREGEDMFDIN